MCGICGFFISDKNCLENVEYYKSKITAMENVNKSSDSYIASNAYFGIRHSTCSLGDTVANIVSVVYKNRKASICFCGNIFNKEELSLKLTDNQIPHSPNSTEEIILYSYLAFGPEYFKELNGVFTFSILENNMLTLVRDHLGVKPLYYTSTDSEFVFSSDLKGIFKYGIKPELSKSGLQEIFVLGPAHTPGNGVYDNIYQLLPGHYLNCKIINNSFQTETKPYWKLNALEHKDDYNTTLEKVRYLVLDSIKKQSFSNLPVCSLLSGGLDSSLVSAVANKEYKKYGKQLPTFAFEFKDNQKNFVSNSFQSSLDRPFVEIMISHLNSEHTWLECNNTQQIDFLYKAADTRDLPCMGDIESSLLYFCKEVTNSHKVALTGECADEIFGGYPWFHNDALLNHNGFPWCASSDFRSALLKDDFIDYLNMNDYQDNAYHKTMDTLPVLDGEALIDYNIRKITWLNINWFMQTLLMRMDNASMYCGIEARVPFADYRILEYVYNIPWNMKAAGNLRKSLLINIADDLLPSEVLMRKKSPYPKTYDPAYELALGDILLEMLNSTNNPLANICDKAKVEKYLSSPSDYGKPWYGQLMAGPQMLAYLIQTGHIFEKHNLSF